MHGWYWANGFLAELAGMTIAGPWLRSWLRPAMSTIASRWEMLAMLAVSGGIAEIVGTGALGSGTSGLYLMFPPTVWAALRTGRRGTSAALFATGVIAAANLTAGRGPFESSGVDGPSPSTSSSACSRSAG